MAANSARLTTQKTLRGKQLRMLAAATFTVVMTAAQAQAPAPDQAAEMKSSFAAAKAVMQAGPADVKLTSQATLHLPGKYVFVPQNEAIRVLKAMGNSPAPDTLGMIFPQEGDENWFVVVRYIASGYIKDDDAKEWKADDLLTGIKESTENANAERR